MEDIMGVGGRCIEYTVGDIEMAESRALNYVSHGEGETPESLLIKKEEFTLLSEEAKEVLRILVLAPGEFLELPESAFASVRKPRVLLTFIRKGWKRKKIRRALKQIEEYIRLYQC